MSAMKRLSEAQRHALFRLANGDELWTTTGRNPCRFWHGNIGQRAPSIATLQILLKAKLVANYESEWRGAKYRITDAGRALLSPHGQ